MNVHPKTGTMKRWTLEALGRANLRFGDAAVPSPALNQILMKASAVSLNYRDLLLIEDGFSAKSDSFVPASDAAGVVVAAGAAVTRFKIGDRVISTFIPGWIDGAGFGTFRAGDRPDGPEARDRCRIRPFGSPGCTRPSGARALRQARSPDARLGPAPLKSTAGRRKCSM